MRSYCNADTMTNEHTMKNWRDTIQRLLCLHAGIALLVATFAAEASIYQCAKTGALSFHQVDEVENTAVAGNCCCCLKAVKAVVSAGTGTVYPVSIKAECCHKVDVSPILLDQGQGFRIPGLALADTAGFRCGGAGRTVQDAPAFFNTAPARYPPPLYLLKQTFLN